MAFSAELLKVFHNDQGHPEFGKLIKISGCQKLCKNVLSMSNMQHRNATFEGRFVTIIPTGKRKRVRTLVC